MKMSTLSILLFAVAIGIGLFTVKHRVQDLESQLVNLNRQMVEDREALQVLRAEWSHLNEPKRLKVLAHKYLGMTAITLDKVISRNELIDKIPVRQEMSNTSLADTSVIPSRKDKVP